MAVASPNHIIRVMPETRRVIESIADHQRWTLMVAMDEAAKALAQKLNIEMPGENKSKRN